MFSKGFNILRGFRNIRYRREAFQTGLLMGTGDVIAQHFMEKKDWDKIDIERTEKFIMTGMFFVGPALGMWYNTLQKLFGSVTKKAALKKVMLDQLFFAPVFTGTILSVLNYTKQFSLDDVVAGLDNYPDIIKNNYKVWPAVQLINFYLIPLKFQVFVVQFVAIFWNTYISWKTNSK